MKKQDVKTVLWSALWGICLGVFFAWNIEEDDEILPTVEPVVAALMAECGPVRVDDAKEIHPVCMEKNATNSKL